MLNHVYRVVFNRSTGCYTAVSETSKSGGKSNNRSSQVGTVPAAKLGKSLRRSAIGVAIAGVLGLTAMSSQAEVCITQTGGTNGSTSPHLILSLVVFQNEKFQESSSAVGFRNQALNTNSTAIGYVNTA